MLCVASLLLVPVRVLAYGTLLTDSGASAAPSSLAVLLVDPPGPTVTAVIELQHRGEADGLAWVLPVRGELEVRVSSSTVFERLDAATRPQYWLEVALDDACKDVPDAASAVAAMSPTGGTQGGVTPVESDATTPMGAGAVSAHEWMTIQVDGQAPDAADEAIRRVQDAGFDARGIDREALVDYLRDGYDLLVLKLRPRGDGGGIRPVMLTYEADRLALPLSLGGGAEDDVELRVWVVGPTHAVPDNHPSLVLNDARIDWLSARRFVDRTLPDGGAGPAGDGGSRPSNYDQVVGDAIVEAGGRGFVTELAGPASRLRERLWWPPDQETFERLPQRGDGDPIAVVTAAREAYGGWDGFREAALSAVTLPSGMSIEEFLRDPETHRSEVRVDADALVQELRRDVVGPVIEAANLLGSGPYLTRLYTRSLPDAADADPTFAYNFDLGQVSRVHVARQRVECTPSLPLSSAPFTVQTPLGAVVPGEAGAPWPLDADSMFAALAVVELSAHGAGEVVVDHAPEVAAALRDAGGDVVRPVPQVPRDGLTIGGPRDLAGYDAVALQADPTQRADRSAKRHARRVPRTLPRSTGCTLSGRPGSGEPSPVAWLALCALIVRCRGSRRSRRRRATRSRMALAALLVAAPVLDGCDDSGSGVRGDASDGGAVATGRLTHEALRDPETCKECHPSHYREWSASMHAYSAMDPVFLAMNRRGQRETDGELGDFCVRCHAPMAVVDGLTTDGLNLEELPDLRRGVSCYYCHNVDGIEDDHNAQLRVAGDSTMRGPLDDAISPGVHGVEYSPLLDDSDRGSSDMCGACHDIVNPNGVRLERTYQEYQTSVYASVAEGDPRPFETCLSCHMRERAGAVAAVAGAPQRRVHGHLFPGVDLALVDFPHRDAMRAAVEDCQLAPSINFFTLEVTPPDLFTFQIETSAGHNQPSGAAQDRRLWLELRVYDDDGELLEDMSSGLIDDGELEEYPRDHPEHDPQLLMLRDRTYGADGEPVHMFWEAAPSPAYPDGYVSHSLPPATTTYLRGQHAIIKQYRVSAPDGRLPARVTARLRMRPIGLDVLQDLVDSGDLDPAVRDAMQTLTVGRTLQWRREDGVMTTIAVDPEGAADCGSYACMLDPDEPGCE
ncbi:MAG: DUF2330 domain-containing protein [Myxococcales bacterium]